MKTYTMLQTRRLMPWNSTIWKRNGVENIPMLSYPGDATGMTWRYSSNFHWKSEILFIQQTLLKTSTGRLESTLNQNFPSLLMMRSRRPFTYHWWKLRRNGRNRFIIGDWLWTNLFLYLKTESRYRKKYLNPVFSFTQYFGHCQDYLGFNSF